MCNSQTLVPIPDLLADYRECADPAHPEFGHNADGVICFAIDTCIVPAVLALWDTGIRTIGCCCGHGSGHAVISFEPTRASTRGDKR